MKKIFSLLTMLLLTCSMSWAAPQTNVGTYSTQVITEDWLTSTWTFILPSSQMNVPTGETEDNAIIYAPSGSSKMKFSSSSQFSWSGQSSGYIPVPAGSAGTISMTPKSSSDTRFLQLFVNGENAGESKRLYSKLNDGGGISGDGKKGPQSFSFTSSDITTKGGKTYLHFKDNNTEMKIATFSITLSSGTYADCEEPATALALSSDAAATIYVGDEITFSTTGGNGAAVSIEGANSETITANVWTATVGTHTFTATQPKNGDYCAQESELVLTVIEKTPVTAVTVAGAETAYEGGSVTYTATAENAAEYRWKMNGAIQADADEATFTYNATTAGNYAIVCEARNSFNAAGVWIASDAKNLVVSVLYGNIVEYTMETGSGNIDKDITAGGLVGATGHQKSQKNGKLGSNGHYLCFTLNQGYIFKAGDIVKISVTPEYNSDKQTYNAPGTLKLASDLANTDFIGEATLPVDPQSSATMLFEITLTKDVNTIYLSRNATFGQNPIVASVVVTRPAAVVSEAWESLTIDNGPTSYNRTGTVVNVVDAYLDPTVVVTKHVVYADATEANVDVEVTDLEVVGNQYVGHVTIGGDVYTINIAKLASYDVTYMDGEVVLGTEVVAANGHPAEFADYQNPQLATFGGWYRDANLTNQVANIASEIISANATYYAKYTKYYATSINIEQWVLDNGMSEDDNTALISLLGTQRYATNITGDLDSLNDTKASRNYDYLGLKVKKNGGLLNFRLAEGNTVKVKFGKVSTTPQVSINGGDYADMTITEKVYTYTATADALVSIKMMDGNAVVFQQIQIGANPQIAEVILPVSDEFVLGANGYSTYANKFKYTVSGATIYKAAYNNGSDAVVLTEVAAESVIPANAGIILKGIEGETVTILATDANATELTDNELVGVVTPKAAQATWYVLATDLDGDGLTKFHKCGNVTIPANKAYLEITENPGNAPAIRIIFAENGATGINELEGAEKAVKFIENGKLYIQKDGVVYDATGAKVK